MDVELGQCLMALPTLVGQMEELSVTSSVDINLIEWLILRTELFLELLRVLTIGGGTGGGGRGASAPTKEQPAAV